MGEIATWSAVKTKVGLGKDSNECPTKAELLALSPTGTGESYIGLEISNASSYGDNETVQLSDIHKVTYKYTFTAKNTTLSFTALGGASNPKIIEINSNKTKYLDGVATNIIQYVDYVKEGSLPGWLSNISGDNPWQATENTTLSERKFSMDLSQPESNKRLTITFTQVAATSTWEYVLQKSNFWSDDIAVFTALGGTVVSGSDPAASMGDSYKQEYRNGHTYGSPVKVPVKVSVDVNWITLKETTINDISTNILTQTATENKSESSRKGIITFTQDVSGKKFTVNRNQAAGVKTYGNVTVTPMGDILDIPASGGYAGVFAYSYSQPWGWNGKTNDGGIITSDPNVMASWNDMVSGFNLGTTPKARTKLGVRTVTVTCNGKSGTASQDVYQAANDITKTTQGAWEVSISANPSTFTEQGGTSQISASARAPRTNTWSSGATNAASDATGTPTLSIPTAVTGFSLSGTTLTVAENTTPNQRSVVVRATMDTVYKEVTVTQSEYSVEWKYYLTTSTPTLNFDALGTTQHGIISSYREKYINGSLVEGSREDIGLTFESKTEYIESSSNTVNNDLYVHMYENTTTQSRTGNVVYKQLGSGKTITISCNQAAGTISTRQVLSVVSPFASSVAAIGGSDIATVKSGYYDVVNGKDTTWYNFPPTVSSKSNFVIRTDITKGSGDFYEIEAHLSENTATTSRTGNIGLTYGSKSLSMSISQAAASVSWSYELKVNKGTQNLNQQVPAKPNGTYTFSVYSVKYKVINGSVTDKFEFVSWNYDIMRSPNWVHVEGGGEVNVSVDENTTTSKRSATISVSQTSSGKKILINIEQQAATITTRDFIDYVEPIPSGDFSALKQSITVTLQSYRETLTNGTVTNKVAVQPDFELDATVTDWASVSLIGSNPLNYEYDFEISVEQNNTINTRSGSVMFYNGTAEVENAWAFIQDGATPEISYDIYWALSDRGNEPIKRVTSYTLDPAGEVDRVHLILLCDKVTKINGTETSRTPISTGLSNLNNYGPVYTRESDGEPASLIQDDGGINESISSNIFTGQDYSNRGSTYQIVIGSSPNEDIYQQTIIMTYNRDVMDGSTAVGKVPAFYWTIDPIPYTRVFVFNWMNQTSLISNITLSGSIMDSGSAVSRDIISYASLRRNGVEFAKKYIKPTIIPPSEDWLQVIDNGQNSDNTYNYAIRALTDNEGESARSQSVRFEQPGNGNQALQAYVSQESSLRERVTLEIGNYYAYGDSKLVRMAISWISPDGSDAVDGMTTPGGYLGAHSQCGVEGNEINMNVIGKPEFGKPLKIRVGNICRAKETGDSMGEEITPLKVSTRAGSDVDYIAESAFMNNFSQYFETSLNIINPTSGTGGTLQIEISLKSTYPGSMVDMQDWTFRPKDPNDPTIYLVISYGD